jgi:DNA-binding transcriptional regulator YhcF (GntR family)
MYHKVEKIAERLGVSQRKIFSIRKFCNEANLTFTVKNTYKKLQTTSSIFLTDFCRAYFAELRRRAELRDLDPKIRSNNNNKEYPFGTEGSKLLLSKNEKPKPVESKPSQENVKIEMLEAQVRSLADKLEKAMMFISSYNLKNVQIDAPLNERKENTQSIIDQGYLSRTSPLQRHIHASIVTMAKDVIGKNGIPDSFKVYITPDKAELISLDKTQMAQVVQHMIKHGRYISLSEIATPESFKKYFENQYQRMISQPKAPQIAFEKLSVPSSHLSQKERDDALQKLHAMQILTSIKESEKVEIKTESRKVPEWLSNFVKNGAK